MHRVAGQRLQGHRGNELARGPGHHYPYLGARITQAPDQLCAFISGNATTDTQYYLLVDQRLHCELPLMLRRRP